MEGLDSPKGDFSMRVEMWLRSSSIRNSMMGIRLAGSRDDRRMLNRHDSVL